METLYFDRIEADGPYSIYIKGAQAIAAGTTVSSMPVSQNNSEYQRFAEAYDLYFIFDDAPLQVPFYTVPQVDIMALDSEGGYIGMVGQQTDLQSDAPICYIDKERNCYLIAENGTEFLEEIGNWKEKRRPYDGVAFYDSLADAKAQLQFIEFHQGTCCAKR